MQASNESKTQNISLIPIQELKPLNVKILQLKGVDEQFYSIIINHLEKSIAFEAFDINDITITKYLTNLTLEDFHKINFFFTQFKEIKDIFALFDDMKEDEFKIIKDTENIELFLLIEIRKKINEIGIILKEQKNDINKIVYNLCEKMKELITIKDVINQSKQKDKLIEEFENLKEKNKHLENQINIINKQYESKKELEEYKQILNEKIENIIKNDQKTIDDLKENNRILNEKLENTIKNNKITIDNLIESNKILNEKLENIINNHKLTIDNFIDNNSRLEKKRKILDKEVMRMRNYHEEKYIL